MNIGDIIKKYRKKFGYTQEHLAYQLKVSSAAVCKWEMGTTNPDISLLIPIAKLFRISVDQLLGYDNSKEADEVNEVLERYYHLKSIGDKKEADLLISKAKLNYPNNYTILNEYMWNVVGGRNNLDRKKVSLFYPMLFDICEKILNECKDEKIRSDALSMKAKLLFVSGAPQEAIKLLSALPSWDGVAEQKLEMLYAYDSPESHYWTTRNLYCMSDGLASKFLKIIWNSPELAQNVKIEILFSLAELLLENWNKTNHIFLLIMAHMLFASLAKKELSNNLIDLATTAISYQLYSAAQLTSVAVSDQALYDLLTKTYKTNDLLNFTILHYETYSSSSYVQLRNNPIYQRIVTKYKYKDDSIK